MGRFESLHSRRTLLKGAGAAAFGVGSVLALPLLRRAQCEAGPAQLHGQGPVGQSDKELIVSNWPAYIDPIKKKTSTLNVFEQQTGISVSYTDDVSDNAEFFAKVRNQLGACEPVKRDLMVLTDWMAARMVGLGWVQPLDAAKAAQPAQEPDQAPAGPAVGQGSDLSRAVAERPDRHRLQRGEDRRGQELLRAAHPSRPQGQDHAPVRDARHDGVHAEGGRCRPRRLHRDAVGRRRSTTCRAS